MHKITAGAVSYTHLDVYKRQVYDFGDVITGRLTCQAVGGPGAAVEVVSGEQRAADGSVICDNVLVAGPGQRDSLHLAAAHEQFNWEARL